MQEYVQEISEEQYTIPLKMLDVFVITLENQAETILLVLRLTTMEMTLMSAFSLVYVTTNVIMSLEVITALVQRDTSFLLMAGPVLVRYNIKI